MELKLAPQLRKIGEQDKQLVRFWRNLNSVRETMIYEDPISREGHEVWNNGLKDELDHFFIYSMGHFDIGVVSVRRNNRTSDYFEGGIFSGNPDFEGHWVHIWALLKVNNFAFGALGLFFGKARVKSSNHKALRMNQAIGYIPEDQCDSEIKRLILTKERFYESTARLDEQFRKIESGLR